MPVGGAISREQRAQAMARRQQVLQYAMGGASLRTIASQLRANGIEISHQQVKRDLDKILEDTARDQLEGLAQYRVITNERLNRLLMAWWPKALGTPAQPATENREAIAGSDPDPVAFDKVMRIIDAQRRVNGVDELV